MENEDENFLEKIVEIMFFLACHEEFLEFTKYVCVCWSIILACFSCHCRSSVLSLTTEDRGIMLTEKGDGHMQDGAHASL